MDNQGRCNEIFKTLRCLDHDEYDKTIEFIESPVARDQRMAVRSLVKSGLSDREVYLEMIRIFGPQVIVYTNINDEVKEIPWKALGGGFAFLMLSTMLRIKTKKRI
jgi:cytochrome c-type biogenesis protein CcmH/NrfF